MGKIAVNETEHFIEMKTEDCNGKFTVTVLKEENKRMTQLQIDHDECGSTYIGLNKNELLVIREAIDKVINYMV
jgi:hypothetical protein